MEGKEFWDKVEKCVEKTLWEQLDLLAERSKECTDEQNLVFLSNAMVEIAKVLVIR